MLATDGIWDFITIDEIALLIENYNKNKNDFHKQVELREENIMITDQNSFSKQRNSIHNFYKDDQK